MCTRSEGLDYFVLDSLVDYLCSSCLSLKMDNRRLVLLLTSWILHETVELCCLKGSYLKLENVLLEAIAVECGVLKLIPRAFCNGHCHIHYVVIGKVEDNRLNKSLLYEWANLWRDLFTI